MSGKSRSARRETAKVRIDQAIRRALDSTTHLRTPFSTLLRIVQTRSDLLRPSMRPCSAEAIAPGLFVDGLLALTQHRKDWLRPPDEWVPSEQRPFPLFRSLAHHLLAKYPVPSVLTSAWFRGLPGHRPQTWFKKLGRGVSVRTLDLPIRLTPRMAHLFTQAPPDLPIEPALRWAQVRGLGGSDRLARALAATRLGREFIADEFWTSVVVFLAPQSSLDPERVEPIIEYINDQKFEPRRIIIGEDTEFHDDPPQPDFSVKDRTLSSLLRRVSEWERERKSSRQPERGILRWEPSGIGAFRDRDDEGRTWTILEILDSDALVAEGKVMDHCAADYVWRCSKGKTTVWSLGIGGEGTRERVLTIEVEPDTSQIVQAKGKGNANPDFHSRGFLERWAQAQGLALPDFNEPDGGAGE